MRIKLRVNNPEPGMAVSHEIEVSKIDTVSKVKTIIKEEVGVSENRLRLFGMGKELFDNDILLQHNFGDDVLLQVMIRPVFSVQQVQETKSEGSQDEPPAKKPRLDSSASGSENRKPVESEYFKPGDIVDAVDAQGNHAWFPAKIVSIDHWNPEYHDTESNAETDGLEYWVKYDSQDENEEPGRVRLGELRLRALKKLTNSDLQAGDRVFVNYNFESPTKLGSWYDAIVVEPPQARRKTMKATVIRGDGTDHEDCAVRLDHGIYEIRDRVKVSERDPREKFDDQSIFPTRACAPRCEYCGDEKSAKCKDCGCHRCGGKADIENQIICDECGMSFHLCCLKPPLESIPEDDWYCSDCKRDENEVVRPGESVKNQKFAKSMAAKALAEKKTHWGNGMATAGHSADKLISWVPKFHFGPIRGIEVGMTWKFRIQVSGHGVHRPPVGGISGQTSGPVKGCVSICLAGGYEDDVDNGDVVIFTGSGGRNLKDGNKRCSAQDSDQMLTAYNLSLAINCTGKDNPPPEGATAKDWKKTPPIRVCRTYKGKKHSKYAPDEGVRYDGIYKIQKYWREKGKSGFYVYRFQLARCDPSPAPWTKEGQKRMRELGFDKVLDAKQCPSEVWKQKYQLTAEERGLIKQDKVNKAKWEECLKKLPGVELVFLEEISKTFLCTICQDLVVDPANSPCGHLFCLNCLKKMMKASECGNLCPDCRSEWEEEHKPAINKDLQKALRAFLPGYDGSKSKTKA